jgi:hypothetical protein
MSLFLFFRIYGVSNDYYNDPEDLPEEMPQELKDHIKTQTNKDQARHLFKLKKTLYKKLRG